MTSDFPDSRNDLKYSTSSFIISLIILAAPGFSIPSFIM